jgi:uncharacterized protein (DUF302 family)
MSDSPTTFGDPAFGITRVLDGVTYGDAVPRVTEALKAEGFGVLTEIDVKATLKKKIDVDHRDYVILGACNPSLAHRALSAIPGVGLLMPCNVVVTVDDDGNALVSAVDPRALFGVVGDPDLEPLADEVGVKLRRVIDAL